MIKSNGTFIADTTSIATQAEILQQARSLVGEEIVAKTLMFSYNGRLLSINNNSSITLIVFAADGKFRKFSITINIIIEIDKIC